MRRLASIALTTASIFLLVVAVMLNSPALFYMSTAMIATLGASRIQAWLAVRGLRFHRTAPEVARAGDFVTVEIAAWSEHQVRRPLITPIDDLPRRMAPRDVSPTMPIAPAFGRKIVSQYRFRPMRRGRYRWSDLTVVGTDALGLVVQERTYRANPVELLVLPASIPIAYDLPSSAGWGFSETEHGRARGHGIEPRGVREYVAGDSLRYVHWASTAKRGQLLVKEFETGSHAGISFFVQATKGSEFGESPRTTLDLACSHLAYLAGWLLRQGVEVGFPAIEEDRLGLSHEREQTLLRVLAELQADSEESLSEQVLRCRKLLEPHAAATVFVSMAEAALPGVVSSLVRAGHPVKAIVYDTSKFTGRRATPENPTNGDYVDQLRSAGAVVSIAPVEVDA